jgi:hypothetical protein
MRYYTFLPALAAFSPALADFVPIHGCEWVPSTAAITDFAFLSKASNTSASTSISWKAPAVSASCKATDTTPIPNVGLAYSVPCSPPENGMITDILWLLDGGDSARITFRSFAQCAADIYAFHYEAVFPLDCSKDTEGITNCAAKGDVVANCTGEEYLPPVRFPPPPPCTTCHGRRQRRERASRVD